MCRCPTQRTSSSLRFRALNKLSPQCAKLVISTSPKESGDGNPSRNAQAFADHGRGSALSLVEERGRQGFDGRAARRNRYRQGDYGNAGLVERRAAQDSDRRRQKRPVRPRRRPPPRRKKNPPRPSRKKKRKKNLSPKLKQERKRKRSQRNGKKTRKKNRRLRFHRTAEKPSRLPPKDAN